MDEWARVVIYPLGLCGFSLFLLWRVHASQKRAPLLQALAGVAFFAGLGLAFLDFGGEAVRSEAPARTGGSSPVREQEPAPPAASKPLQQVNLASVMPRTQYVIPEPPPVETRVLDLSGVWQDPAGNTASITQQGRSLSVKVHWVEMLARMFGMNGAALDYNGALTDCTDGQHAAHAELATPAGARLFLSISAGARRMDGTVMVGYSRQPVILFRQ